MFGLLNIDKPLGRTSRGAVNCVQNLIRPLKVGHAGTLDPLATGVLVLCVGKATRLVEYVQRMPKAYCGTFCFGLQSDTEDIEGKVTDFRSDVQPTRNQLQHVLKSFVGTIEQLPPAYSALKVDGQRAYKLAHRGMHVQLAARKVTIHKLELIEYEFPRFTLEITCGSGTYVRSLGRDIAAALGTAAVMTALRRTAIGPFRVEDASDPFQLTPESIPQRLQPAICALPDLPVLQVSAVETARIWNGRSIANRLSCAAHEIAACDESGTLVAILANRDQQLTPLRNFPL